MSVTVRIRRGAPDGPELRGLALALGEALVGGALRACTVQVNANRSRVISMRRDDGTLHLSVHWSVLDATDDLVALLKRRDPEARARILDRYQPGPDAVAAAAVAAGRHHHLTPLFEAERAARFEAPLSLDYGWGRRARHRRPLKTLRLGSYRDTPPRITIHPVLDHATVPEFMVQFVLFHEMLHAAIPPTRSPGGRRVLHGPDFRARERAHPDYERASRWEHDNLVALLTRAATGS